MELAIILFIFGAAIGSFLNVVALRYDGEHFLFNPKEIGGRSHCPHCKKTLAWFELFPIVSWLVLGGRCRRCKARIGFQYPLVEFLSGLIFVLVPLRFSTVAYFAMHAPHAIIFSAIWIIALEILLLVSYIDIRLGIIPDELNVALFAVGLFEVWFIAWNIGIANPSFFGPFSAIFGLQGNVIINHAAGALVGAGLFGGIVAVTRGRGMGLGDVKLALPLGLLFGWPDIFAIALMAFVIGGIFGILAIVFHKKTMKCALPFGPFLAMAGVIAFFGGSALFNWYFHMIGL
jgi:prepilin signal peptidase PulO-like enzyme (type II secretory pathway)